MSNVYMINEETRDAASLARFVAAVKSAQPLAWQCVERLKAACTQVEIERRTHGDRIEPV